MLPLNPAFLQGLLDPSYHFSICCLNEYLNVKGEQTDNFALENIVSVVM